MRKLSVFLILLVSGCQEERYPEAHVYTRAETILACKECEDAGMSAKVVYSVGDMVIRVNCEPRSKESKS